MALEQPENTVIGEYTNGKTFANAKVERRLEE